MIFVRLISSHKRVIGSMQMTLTGNLPFHGQSRKHDDIDKISHSSSFRIFKLLA